MNAFAMLLPSLALLLAILLFVLLHQCRRRRQYQQRLMILQQLQLLRQLIGALQRHRGLSNGVLCGDDSLRDALQQTTATLNQLMERAEILPRHLADHWSRLRSGQVQDATNNLEQHHLIIRNSIFLLQDLTLLQDLSGNNPRFSHLPLIWNEVLQAAEWAGQALALGTGMAAAGAGTAGQRIRLKFLHQKIRQLTHTAFQALSPQFIAWMPMAQQTLQASEMAVGHLLNCMEQNLLAEGSPGISAQDYFQLATLAIDGLLTLVDINLEALQHAYSYEASLQPALLPRQ